MGLIPLYSKPAGEYEALTKSRIVGVRSVTNAKILIVFVEVVEFDVLKALLMEPFVEDDDDGNGVVVEDTIIAGSLTENGGLVPASYLLVLHPDNGEIDR
jgi:hypothetical protein